MAYLKSIRILSLHSWHYAVLDTRDHSICADTASHPEENVPVTRTFHHLI
jgi:hypothetical protein